MSVHMYIESDNVHVDVVYNYYHNEYTYMYCICTYVCALCTVISYYVYVRMYVYYVYRYCQYIIRTYSIVHVGVLCVWCIQISLRMYHMYIIYTTIVNA